MLIIPKGIVSCWGDTNALATRIGDLIFSTSQVHFSGESIQAIIYISLVTETLNVSMMVTFAHFAVLFDDLW